MSECPHGLDDLWCGVCKHGPTKVERPTIVVSFFARYPGECPGCDLPVNVGQTIHKLSNGRYVHQGCE